MKLKDLKKRIKLAISAIKGAPLIYDYPVPKFKVETQPIQTIQARYEISRPEADMMPYEVVTKVAEGKLMESLMKGLSESGLVQVLQATTSRAIIYEARIRATLPLCED